MFLPLGKMPFPSWANRTSFTPLTDWRNRQREQEQTQRAEERRQEEAKIIAQREQEQRNHISQEIQNSHGNNFNTHNEAQRNLNDAHKNELYNFGLQRSELHMKEKVEMQKIHDYKSKLQKYEEMLPAVEQNILSWRKQDAEIHVKDHPGVKYEDALIQTPARHYLADRQDKIKNSIAKLNKNLFSRDSKWR